MQIPINIFCTQYFYQNEKMSLCFDESSKNNCHRSGEHDDNIAQCGAAQTEVLVNSDDAQHDV